MYAFSHLGVFYQLFDRKLNRIRKPVKIFKTLIVSLFKKNMIEEVSRKKN
jgi:hypothetical protein